MTAVSAEYAEGSLPEARRQLSDAVSALIDPKPVAHDGVIRWQECLYVQLSDALYTQRSLGAAVSKSRPPFWISAADLLIEIDTAIEAWEPRPLIDAADDDLPAITIIRLRAFEERRFRPQDTRQVEQAATIIESWCAEITRLLDEDDNRWRLPAPCPVDGCGARWVYRNDCGEQIRQPALKLTTESCTCQRCKTVWPKERFQILAAVLGYPVPEGVLTDPGDR